jgi:hypothetical protein
MATPPPPKYAAVGTSPSVRVTNAVKARNFPSQKLKGQVAMVNPHFAASLQPHGPNLQLPANSKVSQGEYHDFVNKAAPFGTLPDTLSGEISGPPHKPYVLATVHGKGNGELKDFEGVRAVDAPYADHVHVLPDTLLIPGSPSSVFYSGADGILKLNDVKIDASSLPDHSDQAMAIAAGKAALTAATASKGRTATVPDSPIAHFGAALGYTLEPLGKPAEDGSTHVLKTPKGSSLPTPSPNEIVKAATASLKSTAPPNVVLVTTPTDTPITGLLSVTTAPRSAGDAISVEIENHALHTGIQPADNLVRTRVHVDTHEPHDLRRLTGAAKGDSDESSSSSSDDDDDDGDRNTGKTPKNDDSDDDDDDDVPRRHETRVSGKNHGKRHR